MSELLIYQAEDGRTKLNALLENAVVRLFRTTAAEKYGSGVRRVIETFVAYGLPEPVFESTQGGMAVTVFKQVEQKAPERIGGGANVGANVGANHLLNYIQTHPGQRASEIATAYKLTQRTIERWLKQLKEQDLIEFKGATKTGGYYSKESSNK